jgi:hypothetical protein
MKAQEQRLGSERANVVCPRIVVENPEAFGGEDSLMVRWARILLNRLKNERSKHAA